MPELDAETLFVRFKAQLDSLEQLKSDFKGVHENMEQIMDKFHQKAQDNAKKTMEANKKMFEETEKSAKKAGGGISDAFKEVGNALGINLSKFAGAAGGALSMVAFMDEIRKYASGQILATSMLTGSVGTGSAAQANQYGGFQARMRGYYGGMFGLGSEEEVAKVSGQLLTTRGVGKADLFGKGGTVEQALLMGRSTGMGSDVVAGMFSTMINKLEVDARKVGETFSNLYEMGKKVGSVNGEYVRDVINISTQLKSYGVNLDTVATVTSHFWKDIEKGKVALEDITKAFTMARTTTEGQRAYLGTQVLANDPRFAAMFKGTDVITQQARTQELLEGGRINGRQVTDEEQNRAIRDAFTNAKNMAKDILSQNGMTMTPENMNFFQQKMLTTTTGVNWQNLRIDEQQKLMKEFETGKFSSEGRKLMEKGKSGEFEELMKIGNILGGLEESPLKRIEELMGHLVRMVGGFLLGSASWLLPKGERKFVQDIIARNAGMDTADEYASHQTSFEDTSGYKRMAGMSFLNRAISHGNALKSISLVERGKDKQTRDSINEAFKMLKLHVEVSGKLTHDGKIITEARLKDIVEGKEMLNNDTNIPPSGMPKRTH